MPDAPGRKIQAAWDPGRSTLDQSDIDRTAHVHSATHYMYRLPHGIETDDGGGLPS